MTTSIFSYVAWCWALGKNGIGRIATMQFGLPAVSRALAVAILEEATTLPIVLAIEQSAHHGRNGRHFGIGTESAQAFAFR